jgi:hypothetical protein
MTTPTKDKGFSLPAMMSTDAALAMEDLDRPQVPGDRRRRSRGAC